MRILFFGHLKDVTACHELVLPRAQADAEEVRRDLARAILPALARFRGSVRLARNSEFVGPDAIFDGGDEVALIPPVSGG